MNVGIIGSGTMGSGIAQVAATAGCKVKLYDTNQTALDKAQAALEKVLLRLIEKGRIDSAEKTRIQSNSEFRHFFLNQHVKVLSLPIKIR